MSGMLFTRSRTNSLQKATVLASVGTDGIDQKVQVNYRIRKVVGNGSFGVVILANLEDTSEAVAIKQVLHNPKYKTRELEIMRKLSHPNIVKLKFFFYKTEPKKGDIYLNLILEYVPQTLYRAARNYAKQRLQMPAIYIKLYIYQLFRGMSYLHRQGICHRDVKPQNLLIDSEVGILKICDFGSAKTLIKGETNVAYICSRYYRAPELMFGATDYTCSIDIWSVGTVLVELFLGRPIFIGESAVDQLVEIFKVLGTPTQAQIQTMNPKYKNCSFPQLNPLQWTSIFLRPVPNEAIDLIASILKYAPLARPSAQHASSHPFFYELHCATAKLPSGKPLPTLESDSGSWEKEGEAAK